VATFRDKWLSSLGMGGYKLGMGAKLVGIGGYKFVRDRWLS